MPLTCDTEYAIKRYVETVGWRELPFFIGEVEKLSGQDADGYSEFGASTHRAGCEDAGRHRLAADRASFGPGGGGNGTARSRLGQAEARS